MSAGSSAASAPATTEVAATTAPAQVSMGGFLLKNVTKTVIIWCLNTIMAHGYFRSAALSPVMFPTSAVPARVQQGTDKMGCSICHGFAPYARNMSLSDVSKRKSFMNQMRAIS